MLACPSGTTFAESADGAMLSTIRASIVYSSDDVKSISHRHVEVLFAKCESMARILAQSVSRKQPSDFEIHTRKCHVQAWILKITLNSPE